MAQALVWVCFFFLSEAAYIDEIFLVMRKDAVYTLLLNVTLFPGMRVSLAQDPRYIRFSTIENGITTTYNLKVCSSNSLLLLLVTNIYSRFPMLKLRPISSRKFMLIFRLDMGLEWK